MLCLRHNTRGWPAYRPFRFVVTFVGLQKAVEGVQRVAHMALVRVQARTDDEA